MSTQPQPPAQQYHHLHYGGVAGPKSKMMGSKPEANRTFKYQKRLELMVRMENAGVGEAATAAMIGISVPRLRHLKKTKDYLSARIQITHGIIVDYDKNLALIKAQRKEMLTQMLPPALQVIANELSSPAVSLAERKHKTAVAQDLLDREGTFAKISKTEIKPVDHFSFEEADKASASAIAAIRGVAAPPSVAIRGLAAPVSGASTADAKSIIDAEFTTHSVEAVEANEAFSNSHTLSATDQQLAMEKLEEEAAKLGIHLAKREINEEEE